MCSLFEFSIKNKSGFSRLVFTVTIEKFQALDEGGEFHHSFQVSTTIIDRPSHNKTDRKMTSSTLSLSVKYK